MNVKEVLKKLTIDEKISLLEGKDQWLTNNIDRLDIPSMRLCDGPHGIRKEIPESGVLGLNKSEKAISFPTESTLATSFDKALAYEYGKMLGKEAVNKGVHIVLGPGVNIKRNPLCGRNFEYYSEDPLLSGELAKEVIKGIESNNVGACIKHFACNSQEDYRMTINSVVDERTLREIYIKAFEICVKSGVSSLMTSYNKVNGVYASENEHLITDILRNEWKYKGLVMTDWGGVNDRVRGLNAGCDLEMPSSYGYHGQKLKEAYLKGEVTTDKIDECCERILNLVNKYVTSEVVEESVIEESLKEHHDKAAYIAANSSVLLKNDANILPLREFDKVLFVGALSKKPRYQGGGSSQMNVYKLENVYENISNYTNNYDYCDGYSLEKDGYNKELIDEACLKAKNYNKVVLVMGLFEHYEAEGYDRRDMFLPAGQIKLLEELYKVNRNIAAVVVSGSVVDLSFQTRVKGLLYSGLGGESGAIGILENLYGKVNPSGRLAETFALRLEDYPSTKNFNQTNGSTHYEEGLFVGYRYFTTFNKKTLYPFGYGLSYTSFKYSNLKISTKLITKTKKIKVSCDVKNVGNVAGSEVVMLFVENNQSPVYKAKRELRAFDKVFLKPNETKTVELELEYNDFSFFDKYSNKFVVDSGKYTVQICKNAEEVLLSTSIERRESDLDLSEYQETNYNNYDKYSITSKDFEHLYGKALPSKTKEKVKVITMEDTLEDVKDRFIGKIVIKAVGIVAKKMGLDANETTAASIMVTPFKTIALYAGKDFGSARIEGVVDILNYKIFRGIKKLMKG